MNKRKIVKLCNYIGMVLFVLVLFLMLLLAFSSRWALDTWAGLTMDEIIYHLKAPLEGTGNGMVGLFVVQCVLPAVVIVGAMVIVLSIKKWKKIFTAFAGISVIVIVIFFSVSVHSFWAALDISDWLDAQNSDTSFIKEHYVDPLDTVITFPEKKRNLVFIYLESMETTYADMENGGGFSFNCIPELTNLAQEHEDFSGTETALNGAYVMPSTSWTMGALFGHTSGLPLQISIESNSMNTQEKFFPYMNSLGDILEAEGYRQVFMIGSEAVFGGRELYFKDHGSYEMVDYVYAAENGLIPENYWVFWGYEDKRLFENAKDKLLELAKGEEPFNFTMLTVDTHFEDGYVCEVCGDEFGENQYANVMACSSRQVSEFVAWIQQQDFYENTSIILVGDHLTMDKNFCDDVDEEYDRKIYVNYINPACKVENPEQKRMYTTFDTFPTTLAAMGVEIEGNRLGLGTNLFSDRKTLVEEYGLDYVNTEVAKKSEFMMRLAQLDFERVGVEPGMGIYTDYDEEQEKIKISVRDIVNIEEPTAVEAEFCLKGSEEIRRVVFNEVELGTYEAVIDWNIDNISYTDVIIYLVNESGEKYYNAKLPGDLTLNTNNFSEYLSELEQKENYTIFIAACDEASQSLSLRWRILLENLGLKENLQGKFRSSYYAVIENGKVICEKLGYDEAIYETGKFDKNTHTYDIYSAGYSGGSKASVCIDGVEYAINGRGLNIVVYDNVKDYVVDSVCFDTYDAGIVTRGGRTSVFEQEENTILQQQDNSLILTVLPEYILKLKEEKKNLTVFIATRDEAFYKISSMVQESMYSLGLQSNLVENCGHSYYAIINQGTVQESLGKEKQASYGLMADGRTTYEVESAGFGCGSVASIRLNGKEFSVNSIGLNIVVYDNEKNCVVDAVCFNIYTENTVIRIDGKNKYEVRDNKDSNVIEYLPDEVLRRENLVEYLELLNGRKNCAVFLAIKDEGTAALTEEICIALQQLGIRTVLMEYFRNSFCAVVDNGIVTEEVAGKMLSKEGILSDGQTRYEIVSAGYDSGNMASIKLNGKEFAVDSRGLNIVVYDTEKGCVIDSVCFDTYSGLTVTR